MAQPEKNLNPKELIDLRKFAMNIAMQLAKDEASMIALYNRLTMELLHPSGYFNTQPVSEPVVTQ